MSIKDYIGKKFKHDQIGNVEVVSIGDNSRTKVLVRALDRGDGWDEETKTYKGVRIRTGWYRGENRDYGKIDIVHINTLK